MLKILLVMLLSAFTIVYIANVTGSEILGMSDVELFLSSAILIGVALFLLKNYFVIGQNDAGKYFISRQKKHPEDSFTHGKY